MGEDEFSGCAVVAEGFLVSSVTLIEVPCDPEPDVVVATAIDTISVERGRLVWIETVLSASRATRTSII